MQNLNFRILAKAQRVIDSCETIDQLEMAQNFMNLALKQCASSAYKTVLEHSEEFYIMREHIYDHFNRIRTRLMHKVEL